MSLPPPPPPSSADGVEGAGQVVGDAGLHSAGGVGAAATAGDRPLRAATVAGVVALAAGAGAIAGWAWAALTPQVLLEYFSSGAVPEGYQEEGYMASDGIAGLLMVGVGVALAVLLIALWPRRPLRVLALGIVGALIAAVPLWMIVRGVHTAELAAFPAGLPDGALVDAPRNVRMPAVYLLGAIAVALIATAQAAVLWVFGSRHPR